jgi:YVTN family beta-propeller protein
MIKCKLFLLVLMAATLMMVACASFFNLEKDRTDKISLVEEARIKAYRLPNGWSISPLGKGFETGDMVLNILPTPDLNYMVAINSGYNEHALTLFEIESAQVIERVPLKSSWMGMTWSPDGKILYVSGGNDNRGGSVPIHVFNYDPNGEPKLTLAENLVFMETIEGNQVFWTGLLHHPTRDILYAADISTSQIIVFNTRTAAIEARIKTGETPCALVLSADAKILYISNWSSDSVSLIDTESNTIRQSIKVGDNPNHMVLDKNGRLFIACSNDNSVVIIDTKTEKRIGTIITSMWEKDPEGSTPNFLLLDNDKNTLYVANADNNNLCVVDITPGSENRVLGFIPTGAYPCAIAISPDQQNLIVGSGKGTASSSNLRGPYVGTSGGGRVPPDEGVAGTTKSLMKGAVHIFRIPSSGAELKMLTQQAYRNTPYHEDLLTEAKPPKTPSIIPSAVGQDSPIKHVIYILKENRTYDQILGDMVKGNGDPRIAIFGRDITPNHHALADQFVLFDNYYVDAEVSRDGHSWSDAAYATDYNEKNWPADYGESTNMIMGVEAMEPHAGYIWDLCREAGLTYRSYGEKPTHPSLQGHVAPNYKGWRAGPRMDVENAEEFIKEFDEYERNFDSPDPQKRLPNFSIVSLPFDHTRGGSPDEPTVQAFVGANDLGLGMIVERVTHSKYWEETAIFVTEDDAQDGPDHVDCHRSILLCISPYAKRGIIDHTHYTTSSILRTIELLLGLPPLSQFDAAATPLYNAMGTELNLTPYKALPAIVDLTAKNTLTAYGAQQSLEMDLTEFDRAPMFELNEIIWKLVKGEKSEMPMPVSRYDISVIFPPTN